MICYHGDMHFSYYKVKVTLQAPDKQAVDDAEALLRNKLPPGELIYNSTILGGMTCTSVVT